VYAKSAFILNYDEGGQFFDHAWTPTPPLSSAEGVATMTVDGEVNAEVLTTEPAPIGLGFRVPLLVVSPWSRGNVVVSEILDHVSVIKLVEQRHNITCPNISPWRRAITGSVATAFNFDAAPDYSWPELPDTSNYVIEGDIECWTLPPPVVPSEQSMPKQEEGVRVARPLPYEFIVSDSVAASSISGVLATLTVSVQNSGLGGAPFILYDLLQLEKVNPRQYAVEAGRRISDVQSISIYDPLTGLGTGGPYSFTLMGPNGFVREMRGDVRRLTASSGSQCSALSASLSYLPAEGSVTVVLTNSATSDVDVTLVDNAYALFDAANVVVPAGSSKSFTVSTDASENWYDITVSATADAADATLSKNSNGVYSSDCFHRRFMGHMENGRDSTSDPAMSKGLAGLLTVRGNNEINGAAAAHPLVPDRLRNIKRTPSVWGSLTKADKDGAFYPLEKEEL
jgi:phospholipase C